MSFRFLDFPEATPIDAQRAWTATFESYNERTDETYYVVTLHEIGRETARFMVQTYADCWAGDGSDPELPKRLHEGIHDIAKTGETNTTYTGSMSSNRT